MCTSSTLEEHKTFKFKGKIEHIDIIAMVDSGSTHSFINPSIVHTLSIPTISYSPLTVITASGAQLSSSTICANLNFSLQDHLFYGTFQVLQVAGIDFILGMDWLHNYSPIKMDCHAGIISLHCKGITVKIIVQPVTATVILCDQDINLSQQHQ
jgi:Retroviral aspartyl protease